MSYTTPVRDFRYALKHMAGFDALEATGAYEDLSDDLVEAILEEMGKFVDQEIAPLNWTSDQQGAELVDRAVVTTRASCPARFLSWKPCWPWCSPIICCAIEGSVVWSFAATSRALATG